MKTTIAAAALFVLGFAGASLAQDQSSPLPLSGFVRTGTTSAAARCCSSGPPTPRTRSSSPVGDQAVVRARLADTNAHITRFPTSCQTHVGIFADTQILTIHKPTN